MRESEHKNHVTVGDRSYAVGRNPRSDGSVSYTFSDGNGDSEMHVYHLSPGIKLTHHSVHTDRAYFGSGEKGKVIEIHHCREGRMECSSEDGCRYLMPGDLAVEFAERESKETVFPLRHYHGITVSIDPEVAPKCFSCFLKEAEVQPLQVAERLCGDRPCFVIRSKPYVEHLFSEMYNVPCANVNGYYKIKVLELLLVLSGVEPDENRLNTRTVFGTQVELAKRAAAYLAEHRDDSVTVSSLAKTFHVSITHLQNAFKGVFGVPVCSYMRIQKMNVAALQLAKTDKSVMEIAGEIGYDNAGKFSSAFRKIMNETPLEYRKSHRLCGDR